ncbi:MAG: hypothetical protein ABL986_12215 [Vicinamibacterales bacterium]
MVFHVSEEADIRRFDARLHNYLVPRNCPRVTVAASTLQFSMIRMRNAAPRPD